MAEAKKTTNKEEMVKIKLPRLSRNDEPAFVSVNEKTWLIKRGVEVEVPAYVAKVIRQAEAMQEEIYEFNNSNAK